MNPGFSVVKQILDFFYNNWILLFCGIAVKIPAFLRGVALVSDYFVQPAKIVH